jgi:hypothetical protein
VEASDCLPARGSCYRQRIAGESPDLNCGYAHVFLMSSSLLLKLVSCLAIWLC